MFLNMLSSKFHIENNGKEAGCDFFYLFFLVV